MPEQDRGGEGKAHERLIADLSERYREPLRRYFFRRTRDFAEAEDLTQELFVRIVRKADMDVVENAEAFLFSSAANLLRDRSRRHQISTRGMAEFKGENSDNFEALSPERVLGSKQNLNEVLRALNSVDTRCRNAFILHRIEGMKYAEIATFYGISVSSVEKYIMKCLVLIAKYSNDYKG